MVRRGVGRGRRFAVGLAALALLTGPVILSPAPAYAATCSSTRSGVTVVVDFGSLGGGVSIACAGGDPASGYAALTGAGFTPTGTRDPGFVCRINGKPSAAQDACVVTPPTTAYWSYWHASPGGSWVYSSVGAMGYDPAPGSVEGWAFGAGSPPSITAPRPPAPPPPTKPKPKPTSTKQPPVPGPGPTAPRGTAVPGGAVPGRGTAPGGAAGPSGSAVPGSVSAGAGDTTGSPTDSGSGSATANDAAPPSSSGGGLTGTLIGAIVVAALALAGGFVVLRRRRQAGGPPESG